MTVRLICTLAIALIVSACGGGGGGGGGNTATVLEGTWIKPCGLGIGEDPNNATTRYEVIALTFRNNVVDTSIQNYTDAACTTPAPVDDIVTISATFVIGNSVTASGLSATEIDTTTTTYNGNAATGASYDVFYIDTTTSPELLYFGDTLNSGDATTALTRPTALELTRPYTYQ